MRETEDDLALLRRYVDELEARHGLRSETAAGVRWDIDLALEGDVLALAKCLGQLRTARRHKQGSAILASLETEGGGHGGGDGISGGGPGAGRRDAVDVPSVGGDAMSDSKWTPEMEKELERDATPGAGGTGPALARAALAEIRRLREEQKRHRAEVTWMEGQLSTAQAEIDRLRDDLKSEDV